MKKSICLLLALLTLCGCSDAPATTTGASSAMPSSQAEPQQAPTVKLPAGTAAQEDCQFCGDSSLWNYYRKFDSIGVINLSNAQISDLSIFEYEDDGSLRDNSGFSSMRHNNDDDGHRIFLQTTGGRGICDLSLSWDEGKSLDLDAVAPLYCADCMGKITAMDEDWLDDLAEKGRCPFAMLDFTDGKLYSLNGIATNCFIRDYYMSFQFDEGEIDGVVVYAPERIFE